MPTTTRTRDRLLQQVGLGLMQLARSTSTSEVVDAARELLDSVGPRWHTVDLHESGRRRKRITSWRCPKGFDAFVIRFGLGRRQDRVYHGKSGDVTLVMVKASSGSRDGEFALCAIGLPKRSVLNDAAVTACLGGVLQEALSRLFLIETSSRRAAVVAACAHLSDASIGVFDRTGLPVEAYPEGFPAALQHALAERLKAPRWRVRPESVAL